MRAHWTLRSTIVCVISCALCLPVWGEQEDRDAQKAESFIESVAKTIYYFAWPSATFKSVQFAGFARDGSNLIIQATFFGTGLLGDSPWVKLGLVVNKDGIQDVRVMDHHESLLGPFEASKTLGQLVAELAKESSRPSPSVTPAPPPDTEPIERPAPEPPAETPPVERAPQVAGVTCIVNETDVPLAFEYHWGIAAWHKETLPTGQGLTVWRNIPTDGPLPPLVIRYDNSFAEGYTEQRYVLNTASTALPTTCERAKQYVFTTDGVNIHLQGR
jgi:hypothetical protein